MQVLAASCEPVFAMTGKEALGPVHTETFSCVFVLFQVFVFDFLEYSKQFKKAGKRFRVYGALLHIHNFGDSIKLQYS